MRLTNDELMENLVKVKKFVYDRVNYGDKDASGAMLLLNGIIKELEFRGLHERGNISSHHAA